MRARLQGTKRADGRWQITVTLTTPDGGKVRKTVYGATQREVQDAADKLRKGKNLGPRVTVAELLDEVRRHEWTRHKPKTAKSYETHAKRILAAFGNVAVSDLSTPRVVRWLRASAETLSGRTVQKDRDVLGGILEFAREQGLVETNVARGVRLPKSPKPVARPKMTWPGLTRVLAHEPSPVYRELFLLLAETGLRPDREALDLERPDLFWSADMWWVRIGESKTDAGARDVPVPDYLANAIFDRLGEGKGLLFPSEAGTRLGYRNVIRRWKRLLAMAGEEYTNVYQLRKLATREFRKDLSDDALIALVGHTDIEVTRRHYLESDMAAIAERIGSRSVKKSVNAVPLGLDAERNEPS